MRLLVFVLALANLLFFAYAQGYFGHADNPDAVRVNKQLQPESLKIISRGEPPVAETKEVDKLAEAEGGEVAKAAPAAEAPKEVAKEAAKDAAKDAPKDATKDLAKEPAKDAVKEAAKDGATCSAWAGLSAKDADRLSALLAEKYDDFRQSRRVAPVENGSWWVFIPPQATKADADKKAGELKKLNVTDFFVIQDNGPNRWAISLGVFSSENGANARLAELKEKGVRSAKASARNAKDGVQSLEARGPAARQKEMQAAVLAVLPEAQARACQ